jgi:hypothetical protein
MSNYIHLVKLSVGTETVEDLLAWQSSTRAQGSDGYPRHVTRMWPKREEALLKGGSIYWVIKGFLQCRQEILRLDEVIGADGIRRCAIVLEPTIVRTSTAKKRPFQGWRYLEPDQAPIDLSSRLSAEEPLPAELAGALADIGVI